MTTIAYSKSERVLVSDGRITEGNRIVGENFGKVRKFQSVDFGSVYIACAGNVTHILEVFNFIEMVFSGYEPDGIKFDSETLQVLLMDENGDLYEGLLTESSTDINWLPLDEEYVTIGSGSDFALGALEAGLSAFEAVSVASRRDVFTNNNIIVYDSNDLSYIETLKSRRLLLSEEIENIDQEIIGIVGDSNQEIENEADTQGSEEISIHPLSGTVDYEGDPDEESFK